MVLEAAGKVQDTINVKTSIISRSAAVQRLFVSFQPQQSGRTAQLIRSGARDTLVRQTGEGQCSVGHWEGDNHNYHYTVQYPAPQPTMDQTDPPRLRQACIGCRAIKVCLPPSGVNHRPNASRPTNLWSPARDAVSHPTTHRHSGRADTRTERLRLTCEFTRQKRGRKSNAE